MIHSVIGWRSRNARTNAMFLNSKRKNNPSWDLTILYLKFSRVDVNFIIFYVENNFSLGMNSTLIDFQFLRVCVLVFWFLFVINEANRYSSSPLKTFSMGWFTIIPWGRSFLLCSRSIMKPCVGNLNFKSRGNINFLVFRVTFFPPVVQRRCVSRRCFAQKTIWKWFTRKRWPSALQKALVLWLTRRNKFSFPANFWVARNRQKLRQNTDPYIIKACFCCVSLVVAFPACVEFSELQNARFVLFFSLHSD